MKVVSYDQFVRKTDLYVGRTTEDRENIALYGLVGEIGSLMSAVKKQLLASENAATWNIPTDEIIEELGDIIWYCFSAVQVFFPSGNTNIFNNEIAYLKRMLTATEGEGLKFKALLKPEQIDDFLGSVDNFPKTNELVFDDFQALAIKTARTSGAQLRQVCLSVLWQLGAELLRYKLPEEERKINNKIIDRKLNYILGDIAWHVAAVAHVYGLSLDNIINANFEKISFRLDLSGPTPLHDEDSPEDQQFPRQFHVSFISIGAGKSRMYINGRRLGDDLTDNSYEADGYRFHDIMHLANAAKLGWSPVLRSLLRRKRKGKPLVDEVEDGARARIVEEAVIKAIHSEGERIARQRYVGPLRPDQQDIFPDGEDISFGFLKFVRQLVSHLEVEKNKYWEWEAAILDGYRIFHSLRVNGKGTVTIDMNTRSIEYSPDVYVDFSGPVCGIGSASCVVDAATNIPGREAGRTASLEDCVKSAMLRALGLPVDSGLYDDQLSIKMLADGSVAFDAKGDVEKRAWSRSVVCFRTSIVNNGQSSVCTAIAIADPD